MNKTRKHLSLVLALAMILSLGTVTAFAAPEVSVEETVLVDCDEAKMTVMAYEEEDDEFSFELLLENKSDKDLYFNLDEVAVNGVMCDPFWGETVPAGQKAYDDVYWDLDELQEVGINYIQTVTAAVEIWDDDTYDDVYVGMASWEMNVGQTDMPAVEPVTFSGLAAPVEAFSGDTLMRVVGYDPTGSYDDGPALWIYMENHTDHVVYFTADDVAVNGFSCDPYWGFTLLPDTVGYDVMDWWTSDLEKNHIDAVETVSFAARAEDDDTFEEYNTGSVTVDLVGGASSGASADAPSLSGESASAPVAGETNVLGHVDGNTYYNSVFGLTFTAPDDWTLDSEQDLLEDMQLASPSFAETPDATVEDYLANNDSAYVMNATSATGLETINIQLMAADGLGQYLSEDDLVSLMANTMDLGVDGAEMTKQPVTFGGEEHTALHVEYTDSTSAGFDVDMYIDIVMLVQDDYLLMVLTGSALTNELTQLSGMFTIAAA